MRTVVGARGFVRRRWLNVAGEIPGAGPVIRAAADEADYWRTRDIADEALVQVVMASRDLVERRFRMQPPDVDEVLYRAISTLKLGELADAIESGHDVPDWHGAERPWAALAEAARRWSAIPAGLEGLRRDFVRELGGSFLLPRDAARAVNSERAKMREVVEVAYRCDTLANELSYLETNGGLAKHKARAEGRFLETRAQVAFLLRDVLQAHRDLVAAAWREIPSRMGELFPPPLDEATVVEARAGRQRELVRDVAENALVVLSDGAATSALEYSTLRHQLPTDLRVLSQDQSFAFDEGHGLNGWNALSGQLESARSRFENLTAIAGLELAPEHAGRRTRIIGGLNHASHEASVISDCHRRADDARRAGQPAVDGQTLSEEPQQRFRMHLADVAVAVDELAAAAGLSSG